MDILDEMLPDYRAIAEVRRIQLIVSDVSPGTPAIELDVAAVRRAFHNALSNAVKYSKKGTSDTFRHVSVRCKPHLPMSGGFEVTFENFGMGIKPHEKSMIWEARYRGELARALKVPGSGLGLKQIRCCMTRHGGTARIESELQGGGSYKTRLTLIFPARRSIGGGSKHG